MKKNILLFTTAALLFAVEAFGQSNGTVSLEAMAPSVIRTIPVCGDGAVDPSLKEIKVTFSKDMKTNRMWAICQISKESFPEGNGDVHYIDDRTCVMPVKLEPNKTYVLWFNRAQFNSFRDKRNNPSVPYQLVFKTKGS